MELTKVTTTTIKLNADLGGGVISANKTAYREANQTVSKKSTFNKSHIVRNKAEQMTETFSRQLAVEAKILEMDKAEAAIEKAIAKKRNFFNKHKNKN